MICDIVSKIFAKITSQDFCNCLCPPYPYPEEIARIPPRKPGSLEPESDAYNYCPIQSKQKERDRSPPTASISTTAVPLETGSAPAAGTETPTAGGEYDKNTLPSPTHTPAVAVTVEGSQ